MDSLPSSDSFLTDQALSRLITANETQETTNTTEDSESLETEAILRNLDYLQLRQPVDDDAGSCD